MFKVLMRLFWGLCSPKIGSLTEVFKIFTPSLKSTSFTNPTPLPVVSLLPTGLPPRTFACTVSSELLGLYFIFPLFFRFWAVR